ncbi:MAG: hypothetical protein R2747_00610 [Pyrinomonadaceae bacterium]
MRTEEGNIEGDVTVDGTFKLHGIIDGNITIVSGGILDLFGTCRGNVLVEKDGALNLHGIVDGDIFDQGGKLDISGTLRGSVKEGE